MSDASEAVAGIGFVALLLLLVSGSCMLGQEQGEHKLYRRMFVESCSARCPKDRAVVDTSDSDRAKWRCACSDVEQSNP